VHVSDVIRRLHSRLIEERVRDETTFMVSGGIAMAEHVIKSMLCGANLVGVDVPLLIALHCRVCRTCVEGGECPVRLSSIDSGWGSNRIVNLIAAWHNQLLEMMGAMGIREARRLRGEQGRIMFREDLEADTFARLFGPISG
jgi:glutamate synthase domain-containing protein 2